MIEVGVRELRDNLSEYLRRVGAGEQLRVTSHGRALADVVPVSNDARDRHFRELAAQGRLTLPTKPLPRDAPEPVKVAQSAAQLIIDDRDSER